MANYYTIITAEGCVPCTLDEFNNLKAMLAAADERDEYSGLAIEYWDKKEDPKDWGVYINTDESVDVDAIPEDFLKEIGRLLTVAKKAHLGLGIAYTCDRYRPGSHGGTAARIYPDGRLVYILESWPPERDNGSAYGLEMQAIDDLKLQDLWADYEPYPRQDWLAAVEADDTQLGYWEWVEHQVEAAHA